MARYLEPKRFKAAITSYRNGTDTEELWSCFHLLADKVVKAYYANKCEHAHDDMVSEATINCIRVQGRYDESFGSPFNYFTTTIRNVIHAKAKSENSYKRFHRLCDDYGFTGKV